MTGLLDWNDRTNCIKLSVLTGGSLDLIDEDSRDVVWRFIRFHRHNQTIKQTINQTISSLISQLVQ